MLKVAYKAPLNGPVRPTRGAAAGDKPGFGVLEMSNKHVEGAQESQPLHSAQLIMERRTSRVHVHAESRNRTGSCIHFPGRQYPDFTSRQASVGSWASCWQFGRHRNGGMRGCAVRLMRDRTSRGFSPSKRPFSVVDLGHDIGRMLGYSSDNPSLRQCL